jgi:hypothetical protein
LHRPHDRSWPCFQPYETPRSGAAQQREALLLVILWQVVTQWKVETEEAKNLRFLVLIFGVIAAALVVWFFMK